MTIFEGSKFRFRDDTLHFLRTEFAAFFCEDI